MILWILLSPDYKAVDGLGRQQVLACTVMVDSVDSTCRTNGITPVVREDVEQWFNICFLFCSLVSGDVEGRFDQLFSRINSIQKKSGTFDVSAE